MKVTAGNGTELDHPKIWGVVHGVDLGWVIGVFLGVAEPYRGGFVGGLMVGS